MTPGPASGKPKLPRGRVPPPTRVHKDRKKEDSRTACRRFRKGQRKEPGQ